MVIKVLTDIEFDTFCIQSNYIETIYQTSTYKNIIKNENNETLLLGLLNENNTIIAASLIIIENINGFKYATSPRGFILDYNNEQIIKDFTHHIKLYLKQKNVVAIKLNPLIIKNKFDSNLNNIYTNQNIENTINLLKELGYHHFGYNNYFEAIHPRFEANLKLDNNYQKLFNNIKKSFRTKMRNADRNGISIHKGNISNIYDLYNHTKRKDNYTEKFLNKLYEEFNKNKQCDIYYAKLNTNEYLKCIQKEFENQESICEKLDLELIKGNSNLKLTSKKIIADNKLNDLKNKLKEATSILRNYPNGIIIASALVITNNKNATLFIEGYNKKYSNINAKHLLIWKLIEKYSKENFENFNLGGIINPNDNYEKYKGLNEFKLGFNPEINEYIGDLELICNNTLYFMYRNSINIKKIIKK